MSSFFDSELVQAEMEEINDLQAEIYKEAFRFPELSVEEKICLLYTSPSPRDLSTSRMPSSA